MKAVERLTAALAEAGAPEWMMKKARAGQYDDFRSDLEMPIHELVNDASACGLKDIAARAKTGEFDGTTEDMEVPEL